MPMSHQEEVNKAVGAHGLWKGRLKTAIATGKSDVTVDKVRADNQCDFGKWLGSLPPAELKGDSGKRVKELHAKFHAAAANALDLALSGKKKEAEEALGASSEFSKVSMELTQAMMTWAKGK
jgi:hypothetical protein